MSGRASVCGDGSALAEDIASGALTTGERLPSSESLAARFSVNRHTVLKAISHLESEGLVRIERGRGAYAVVNPIEKMLIFADAGTSEAAKGSSLAAIFLLLLDGLGSVLARYTFVLHSSPRPTVFLIWLIIPGIVYAWRQGKKQLALQSLLLMGAAMAASAAPIIILLRSIMPALPRICAALC